MIEQLPGNSAATFGWLKWGFGMKNALYHHALHGLGLEQGLGDIVGVLPRGFP